MLCPRNFWVMAMNQSEELSRNTFKWPHGSTVFNMTVIMEQKLQFMLKGIGKRIGKRREQQLGRIARPKNVRRSIPMIAVSSSMMAA